MLTYDHVKKQLEDRGLKATTFILEDGSWVNIEPCFYEGATTIAHCDYFLAYHSAGISLSNSKLEKVIERVNRIDEIIEEEEQDKIKLRKYFEDHEENGWDDDSWGWYSDWHKVVYGYRPHGHVCGVYVNPHTGLVEG